MPAPHDLVVMAREMAGTLWFNADRHTRKDPAFLRELREMPQHDRNVVARATGHDRSPGADTWRLTVMYVASRMRSTLRALPALKCPDCRGRGLHVVGIRSPSIHFGQPIDRAEEHRCTTCDGAGRMPCGVCGERTARAALEGTPACPACATEVPALPAVMVDRERHTPQPAA